MGEPGTSSARMQAGNTRAVKRARDPRERDMRCSILSKRVRTTFGTDVGHVKLNAGRRWRLHMTRTAAANRVPGQAAAARRHAPVKKLERVRPTRNARCWMVSCRDMPAALGSSSEQALARVAELWQQERLAVRRQTQELRDALAFPERVKRGLALKQLRYENTEAAGGQHCQLWFRLERDGALDGSQIGVGDPVVL